MNDAIHPVDRHVGQRMRLLRKQQNISQEKLAEALGLTFQQVQKYERGANRISASKLYEAARFLRVPISEFYFGLPQDDLKVEPVEDRRVREFVTTESGHKLVRALAGLPPPMLGAIENLAIAAH